MPQSHQGSTCHLCENPATVGLLCAKCLGPISESRAMCAEQIVSTTSQSGASACLIDKTGHAHPLSGSTLIGREAADLTVYSTSVSRRHALIRSGSCGWTVEDLGSSNGTSLDGLRLPHRSALREGAIVMIADVGFRFSTRIPELAEPKEDFATTPLSRASAYQIDAAAQIRLMEPTRGGGGVLEIAGSSLQVTLIQFALIRALVERLEEDREQPSEVRGFIPSVELLATLPWSALHPVDAHLKQVVRRLRKRLAETALSIESRRGFGYRIALRKTAEA